jgi:hypothetical protein
VAHALGFAGHQITLHSTPEAVCGVGENLRRVVPHLRGFRSMGHPEHCNNHLKRLIGTQTGLKRMREQNMTLNLFYISKPFSGNTIMIQQMYCRYRWHFATN